MLKITSSIIILFLMYSISFSQNVGGFNFIAKPDTIIEKKQNGFVYITSDTNSMIYNWIIPNPNDNLIKSIYADYLNDIKKKYNQEIVQFPISTFPRKWNSVYVFRNDYFLYGPSDWLSNTGFYVSDSVIYITSSDPSDIYIISAFKSHGIKNANFTVVSYSGETKFIDIKVINLKLGIYEWTLRDKLNNYQKFLMQNSDFSKKLKMIVCDCGDEKCFMEFEFETNK